MASSNRSDHYRLPTYRPSGGTWPALSFFAADPGAEPASGGSSASGASGASGGGASSSFRARPRTTNRVWAIERVGPPPGPNPPDQLAKVALLWADATMLVVAALGTALLVAAMVL